MNGKVDSVIKAVEELSLAVMRLNCTLKEKFNSKNL